VLESKRGHGDLADRWLVMRIHDWTRVHAGIFHDFHATWIPDIKRALNRGLLPPDYYALAEQIAGNLGPDVLTLQRPVTGSLAAESTPSPGGIAVADAPNMPLFLTPEVYVSLPLEATYNSAWEAVPSVWQEVLAAPPLRQDGRSRSGRGGDQ
jgi:hypothetical protein